MGQSSQGSDIVPGAWENLRVLDAEGPQELKTDLVYLSHVVARCLGNSVRALQQASEGW